MRWSHYAPPRLRPLAVLATTLAPQAFEDCDAPKAVPEAGQRVHGRHEPAVTAPVHVLTGTLRRGWLGHVGPMVMAERLDVEERLVAARSTLWKELRERRPAALDEAVFEAMVVSAMREHAEPEDVLRLVTEKLAIIGEALK